MNSAIDSGKPLLIDELNQEFEASQVAENKQTLQLQAYIFQTSIEPLLLSKSPSHCLKSEFKLAAQSRFTMYKLVRSRALTSAVRAARVGNLQSIDSPCLPALLLGFSYQIRSIATEEKPLNT